MTHNVTVRYSNGVSRQMPVFAGQTLLDAAEAQGVPIVNECRSGICGTCVGTCVRGNYDLGRTEGLSADERGRKKILTCQTLVKSDCVVDLEYPDDANAASLIVGEARITQVEIVSKTTAILRVDAAGLGRKLAFRPGQYAELQVPGTDAWRSYSYAHLPNEGNQLEFIIRLLPGGQMSDYLRERARPSDVIRIRGSKGVFYLRESARPVLLIAGGTGLSA
ncbi:MAG: FAD-binding oxidoreductase, partial [Salinisphaera sp.]|nr:FAD-binding oxidoreductase [Salinisphaera sp.]